MKIAITCPASLPATPFGGILIVAVNLTRKACVGLQFRTIRKGWDKRRLNL